VEIEQTVADVERDAMFTVASSRPALALGFSGDETDEPIVLARQEEQRG
jgi:hypothetical protein